MPKLGFSYIDTVGRKSCVSHFCEVEILNPTDGKTCKSTSVHCCGVTRIISFYNFGIPVKCQVWLLYFCASFRDGFHCFRSTQFYTNPDAFVRTLLIWGLLKLLYLNSTIVQISLQMTLLIWGILNICLGTWIPQ